MEELPAALRSPPHRRAGDCIDLIDDDPLPAHIAALERFLAVAPKRAAVIATTGKCGRELFTLYDRPQHLYQVGSMGCASAMALGVALNSKSPVVVLDGDGSALMKLGNMATIGAYAPENFIHVILDNNAHDFTGGQPTSSQTVDFALRRTELRISLGKQNRQFARFRDRRYDRVQDARPDPHPFADLGRFRSIRLRGPRSRHTKWRNGFENS